MSWYVKHRSLKFFHVTVEPTVNVAGFGCDRIGPPADETTLKMKHLCIMRRELQLPLSELLYMHSKERTNVLWSPSAVQSCIHTVLFSWGGEIMPVLFWIVKVCDLGKTCWNRTHWSLCVSKLLRQLDSSGIFTWKNASQCNDVGSHVNVFLPDAFLMLSRSLYAVNSSMGLCLLLSFEMHLLIPGRYPVTAKKMFSSISWFL